MLSPHHPDHTRGQRNPALPEAPAAAPAAGAHPPPPGWLPAAGHEKPTPYPREFKYFSLLNTNTSRHMGRISLRGLRITPLFYPHENPMGY